MGGSAVASWVRATFPELDLSKTKVNGAGVTLAAARLSPGSVTETNRSEAFTAADAWRQLHAEPLAWVTDAVRRRVGRETVQAVISQRLKRMPQIVKKLCRYEKMNLARMHDIGGCRVIVDGPHEVNRIDERIRGQAAHLWPCRYRNDYRVDGRPDTGYRALHLVVQREGRLIEIQLRTLRQHAWAEAVERVTALSDHAVKEGEAPDEVMEYFRLASDGFWRLDLGKPVSAKHRARCRKLHRYVEPFLRQQAAV